MSGRYEDDETIPEQWRPRREPVRADDTTRMAPIRPPEVTQPRPQEPRRSGRRFPAAIAGLLVAFAVLIGVAIGHDVWGAPSPLTVTSANGLAGQGIDPSANVPAGPAYGGSPFGGSSSAGGSGSSSSGSGSSSAGSGGSSSTGAAGTPASSGSGAPANAESIAAKVDPALVDINSTFKSEDAKGSGTGIVLTANGEILTNNHVVDLATSISVTDVGNGKTYPATVVGYDSAKDIAVLQLQGASGLQTAKIGDSSTAAVGDQVVAIGNAGGTGRTPSTAAGSITGLNRSITAGDDLDGSSEQLTGLIQTNADVQPGDSGGSLVNSSGEVIGVDTAASEGFSFRDGSSASQGFAIPIDQALALAGQIESGQGSSTVHVGPTAFLGVYISSANAQANGPGSGYGGGGYGYSGGYSGGSSGSTTAGATIAGVVSGGAADKAGLAANDVITSLDGQTVDAAGALTKVIVGLKPGQTVSIGWVDASGQSHTGTVDLGTGPPA
ncbi:MAG TPA: trypsin-like peptidase domain-containing protein [Solirubrobacteraceae bacterium]|nr:trypsin-like peptidase domain-containing protein [Solirubrobacteraceae bacterium]